MFKKYISIFSITCFISLKAFAMMEENPNSNNSGNKQVKKDKANIKDKPLSESEMDALIENIYKKD